MAKRMQARGALQAAPSFDRRLGSIIIDLQGAQRTENLHSAVGAIEDAAAFLEVLAEDIRMWAGEALE